MRRTVPIVTKKVRWSAAKASPFATKQRVKAMSTANSVFGICQVTLVDYEEMMVALRTLSGEGDTFERVQIPMSFPGAGNRHFLGALPEVGDICVVGYIPRSTEDRQTKTPVILGWFPSSGWLGREWETSAGFTVDEHDPSTPKDLEMLRGSYDRIRHKQIAGRPGDVLASSGSGSDFILNEGVYLSNRRGGEIRLRDQDNAHIVRALQQFSALSGVRSYTGMVQRDANVLPPAMVSDGREWAGSQLVVDGTPVHESLLPESLTPEGRLTPARVFDKPDGEKTALKAALHDFGPNLDPFRFLRNGGFIDESGYAVRDITPSAIYGGKPLYRTALNGSNGVTNTNVKTFVEHRIEVDHASDGTLPVNEQTDGFDADRLPDLDPDSNPRPKKPFIEHVLGTVVGNDPYTAKGLSEYGKPLVVGVFSPGGANPSIRAADLTREPLEEQAASLFLLRSLKGDPSFISFNKKGQLRASIGGVRTENSVEASLTGGLRLKVGGALSLDIPNGVEFMGGRGDNETNVGFRAGSEQGAAQVFGMVAAKGSEFSLDLYGHTGARLRSKQKVEVVGQAVEVEGARFSVSASDLVEFMSANRLSLAAQEAIFAFAGKRYTLYSGPKAGLPSNGALHEEVFSSAIPGGVARKTRVNNGDLDTEIDVGSIHTSVGVGNVDTTVTTGRIQNTVGANDSRLSNDRGYALTVRTGNVNLQATSGSVDIVGTTEATMQSTGIARVKGLVVRLEAPIVGPDQGPIICAGSLDPFTGLPFAAFGMGAKNHIVG